LTQTNLPKNYLTLLTIISFGIVPARAGFEEMTANVTISLAGIPITFLDKALCAL
jgi:hypothetical protein